MKTESGKCKFCNQIMMIEVPESYTQAMVDDEVSKRCSCPEAHEYAEVDTQINLATEEINRAFEKKLNLNALKKILLSSVEPIARKSIDKIQLAKDGYSVTMKRTKDGIKIAIKHTEQENFGA